MSASAAGRIGFISLLVAVIAGCPGGQSTEETAKQVSAETTGLRRIADAFKSFNEDTGGWPHGRTVWYPAVHEVDGKKESPSVQLEPTAFTANDLALFQLPTGMKQCAADAPRPCWNGPYLTGKSLLDASYLDAWGHARLYLLARPADGLGGGVRAAPAGYISVWSAGPDGKDGFGCSDASCARNWDLIVKGQASSASSDDVSVAVGPAQHT